MSQQSKYEYEKALNKDASVTVFQFDLAKDSTLPQKSVWRKNEEQNLIYVNNASCL